jgi:hypothetical protein
MVGVCLAGGTSRGTDIDVKARGVESAWDAIAVESRDA